MPSGPAGQLFLGTTVSPVREFIAERIDPDRHARVILPCVGRWAVATAAAKQAGADRIEASDLSLFSSVIGYLADPTKTLEQLEVRIPDGMERFVDGAEDEVEWGAGALLCVKFLSSPAKSAFDQQLRNEIWRRAVDYRGQVAEGLRQQVDLLAGCSYEVADVRAVTEELVLADPDDAARVFYYVNPPGYAGGYTKMYGVAERMMWEPRLETGEFHPDEAFGLLASLTESPATVLGYVHHGDDAAPEGWVKLMAHAPKEGRVDYIVANRDPDGARLTIPPRADREPRRWPIYNEQEITPESVIEFVKVDKDTALHYRDLFVHRLGQSSAQWYGLMLIDGRVVTAFGLLPRALIQGISPYLSEVFGISMTSRRYGRLGKLFMLALTCGDFKRWAQATWPNLLLNYEPHGIETASPTLHHEGKTDRGVLKLVRRVELPNGGFQLLYTGDFRLDETFADVMAGWHKKFGHISRPGWAEVEHLYTTPDTDTEETAADGTR
jgi:hypothetical protein